MAGGVRGGVPRGRAPRVRRRRHLRLGRRPRGLQRRRLRLEGSTVMTASSVHPPARPTPRRPCGRSPTTTGPSRRRWRSWARRTSGHRGRSRRRRAAADRSLVEQGRGQWFGAFLDGRLVASLGLFVASAGLARFQEVKTHPDFRGRGLCGTLVHHASRYGLDELGVATLVMVADPATSPSGSTGRWASPTPRPSSRPPGSRPDQTVIPESPPSSAIRSPPSHEAIGSGAVWPSPYSSRNSWSRSSPGLRRSSWRPHTVMITRASCPG